MTVLSPTRPEGGAATVRGRSDRSPLRESAVCSQDIVRLFGPTRGRAATGSAPTLRRPRGIASHTSASGQCGATALNPRSPAYCFTTCQTRRSVTPSPQHLPARQTQRNSLPAFSSAAVTQSSTVVLTQHGTGTVRMCPPLPTRSTIAQCSSQLLQMRKVQFSQFASPKPAAEQHCENRAVPFAFEGVGIRSLPKPARLL